MVLWLCNIYVSLTTINMLLILFGTSKLVKFQQNFQALPHRSNHRSWPCTRAPQRFEAVTYSVSVLQYAKEARSLSTGYLARCC